MSQFVESLRRLYCSHMISQDKVVKLFDDNKITEQEKQYILMYDGNA